MICPLCEARKARRQCPAMGREICPVCCGTKRLVEIRCPADCPWLAVSRAHPPAAVLRQRERDGRFLLPMLAALTDGQYLLVMVLQDVVRRYRATAIPPLVDDDVRQAAEACAATLETATKGIIFEHQPGSLTAQRLGAALTETLRGIEARGGAGRSLERDAAVALRRLEWAAREARTRLEPTDTAYLDMLGRMPSAPDEGRVTQARGLDAPVSPSRGGGPDASRIILP